MVDRSAHRRGGPSGGRVPRRRIIIATAAFAGASVIGVLFALAAVAGVATLDEERYTAADTATLTVTDADRNVDASAVDSLQVNFKSETDTTGIAVTLQETGNNTGVFTRTATFSQSASNAALRVLHVSGGDTITLTYSDASPAGDRVATATMFENNATATLDQTEYAMEADAVLTVNDVDGNLDSTTVEDVSVTLDSTSDSVGIDVTLTETGVATGVFTGAAKLTTATDDGADELEVAAGDTVTLEYLEPLFNGIANQARSDTATINDDTVGDASLRVGVTQTETARYALADAPILRVVDPDLDTSVANESVDVSFTSTTDPMGITVTLNELTADQGTFQATADFDTAASLDLLDVLQVSAGDTVTLTYADAAPMDTITATATMFVDDAVSTLDRERYRRSHTANLQVTDIDRNDDVTAAETLSVNLFSDTDGTGVNVTLTETGPDTGVFSGTATFIAGLSSDPLDQLQVAAADIVTLRYAEPLFAGGTSDRVDTATMYQDNGSVTLNDTEYTLNETATIEVDDIDANADSTAIDTVTATLASTTDATGISVTLTETGNDTGIFQGTATFSDSASDDGSDVLLIGGGDTVTATYLEPDFAGTGNLTKTDTASVPVNGTIALDDTRYQLADTATLTVTDADVNTDAGSAETVDVAVVSDSDATGISVTLDETGNDTGVFTGTLTFSDTASDDLTDVLLVAGGDDLTATYAETTTFDGPSADRTATASMVTSNATVALDADRYALDDVATITVTEPDANTNAGSAQTVVVTLTSGSDATGISVTLTETGNDTGIFTGSATFSDMASDDVDDILLVGPSDAVIAEFEESLFEGGTETRSDVSVVNTNGSIFLNAASYALDDTATLTVSDPDANTDTEAADTVVATLASTSDPGTITVTLTETESNIGVFQGTATFSDTATDEDLDVLLVAGGDDLTATYTETTTFDGPDADRTAASVIQVNGTVAFDAPSYQLADAATLTVTDADVNTDAGSAETVDVAVVSDSDATGISVTLDETGNDTGVFTGTLTFSDTASDDLTDVLLVAGGDVVTATYTETTTFEGPDADRTATATMFVEDATVAFDPIRYSLADTATVGVEDVDANTDPATADTVDVGVTSDSDGTGISVTLNETGNDTGVFTGTLTFSDTASDDGADVLLAAAGDVLTASYEEGAFAGGTTTRTGTATMFVDGATASLDAASYALDDTATLTVTDVDGNLDPSTADTVEADLSSTSDPGTITVTLTETGATTGTFSGTGTFSETASDDAADVLLIAPGDVVTLRYGEPLFAGSSEDRTDTAGVPTTGTVALDAATYDIGDAPTVTVTDPDLNTDAGSTQSVDVTLASDSDATGITVSLGETGNDTGVFTGSATVTDGATDDAADLLNVSPGDEVTATYADTTTFEGPAADHTDSAQIQGPAVPFDFDGSGGADLAVGVPGEDRKGKTDAGGVNVIYSGSKLSSTGNQFWHQGKLSSSPAQASAGFGSTVASGDFNADGFADLAAGAPGYEVADRAGAGAVSVIYGSAAGLDKAGNQLWHQNSPGIVDKAQPADDFGAALAVGDFDGDGFADLAIGVPGENFSGARDAGSVHILYGSADGLSETDAQRWHQSSGGTEDAREGSDGFGTSLAAGDLDGDGSDDLAIGVPGEVVNGKPAAGGVHVLFGSGTGLTADGDQFWTQASTGVKSKPKPGEVFGVSLAIGDLNADGTPDLAIGVPGEVVGGSAGAGAVNILFSVAGTGPSPAGDTFLSQDASDVPSKAKADESFGFSLSAGDVSGDGDDDLAVGVPGETVGGNRGAGAVQVFYGGPGGPSGADDQIWHQKKRGIASKAKAGDVFGFAVLLADFNGDGAADLAVGALGERVGGDNAAGAVNVIYSNGTKLKAAGDQFWHQNSTGIIGRAQVGDVFGFDL